MEILVTNDDSIYSKGIKSLINVAKKFGNITVVAPVNQHSAMGHSITIREPIEVYNIDKSDSLEIYGISGTPVDCVKLASKKIMKKKPDLVLSGINHGANYSINILYSGTVSAAMEAQIENIPAIAFSLCDYSPNADFEPSEKIVALLINWIKNQKNKKNICLNVNIPKLKYEEIKGIKFCEQAEANWVETFEDVPNKNSSKAYKLGGDFVFKKLKKNTDLWALENKFVSVVPILNNFTNNKVLNSIKNKNIKL